MSIPGPAPKAPGQKRRRNAPTFATTKIPAIGRGDKPAPDWPSGVTARKPPKAMVHLWEELWAIPQAFMWEKQSLERTVARYVLMLHRQMTDPIGELKRFAGEVRMMEDRLGLSSSALLKLRWEIEQPEVEEQPRALAAVTPIRRVAAVDPVDAVDQEDDDDPAGA